jgi:LPXTG-motif cell wall-anchored protein
VFTGGDGNGNDLLDLVPAEVWTYECTGVITEQTVDVAVVEGLDIFGVPVFDVDGAIVTPYSPGIAITKVADPVELPLGGGPVTYSYEVTNTGDVPLAEVNTRVTDDRCAPVEAVLDGGFNVGDLDRNGLLTGDDDLFETGGPETWLFSCTTSLTETTVNVVTTLGTPVRPVGGETEVLGPDVSAEATAEVRVPEPGEITIIKVADPAGRTPFPFSGGLGAFTLVDDGSSSDRRTFSDLAPGEYRVTEGAVTNWQLETLVCVDPSGDSTVDVASATATVDLGAGESVTCTFTNRGGADLPATGSSSPSWLLSIGFVLLVVGMALVGVRSRRRTA